jgi:hypothetical protein
VVGPFIRELDEWLRRHNHDLQPRARLRLRVAVHHGVTLPAELGYAGAAPVHVCRIRDARAVRDVLDAFPEANLVLAISKPIFEDSINQRHTSLSADDFVRVEVVEPAKQFSATAWLHVPGIACEKLRTHLGALAVGMRFADSAEPPAGFFDQVVRKSFDAAGVPLPEGVTGSDGNLAFGVPAGLPGTLLAGTWVEHLRKAVAAQFRSTRMAVGIALDPDPAGARSEAVDLAGSDPARRLLATATQGRIVIVASDQFYRSVVSRGGRLVFPDAYRPAADSECWFRVPGYSAPPEAGPPQAGSQGRTDQAAIAESGSATTYGDNSPAIGTGMFTAPWIMGGVHNYDGRRP